MDLDSGAWLWVSNNVPGIFQKPDAYWYRLIYVIHTLIVALVRISEKQHISQVKNTSESLHPLLPVPMPALSLKSWVL